MAPAAVASNGNHAATNGHHFVAAPDINDDPDRVKFAYWVPNVSGGLVISKIPQRTQYDTHSLPFNPFLTCRQLGLRVQREICADGRECWL
jgi:hypothetical protein